MSFCLCFVTSLLHAMLPFMTAHTCFQSLTCLPLRRVSITARAGDQPVGRGDAGAGGGRVQLRDRPHAPAHSPPGDRSTSALRAGSVRAWRWCETREMRGGARVWRVPLALECASRQLSGSPVLTQRVVPGRQGEAPENDAHSRYWSLSPYAVSGTGVCFYLRSM